MKINHFPAVALAAIFSFGAVAPALADWLLVPEQSHVAFVSIKGGDVAEIHSFRELAGSVDASGKVTFSVALDSLDTGIPIRDERMRELLFRTLDFPNATLVARIEPTLIDALDVGEIGWMAGEGVLSLHGREQPLTIELLVARVAPDVVLVASRQPLVLDAEVFGLSPGIEQLRELAGLERISHAVPVSFAMTFARAASPSPAD